MTSSQQLGTMLLEVIMTALAGADKHQKITPLKLKFKKNKTEMALGTAIPEPLNIIFYVKTHNFLPTIKLHIKSYTLSHCEKKIPVKKHHLFLPYSLPLFYCNNKTEKGGASLLHRRQ